MKSIMQKSNYHKTRVNYTLPLSLNLGSFDQKIAGFQGIDVLDCGQEIVWDVTNGLPLPDNSVDAIYSSHFIEHILDSDLCNLFNEILRVCKNGALCTFACPHSDRHEAYYMDHVSFWNEKKVQGFCQGYASLPLHFDIVYNRHSEGERDLNFQLRVVK